MWQLPGHVTGHWWVVDSRRTGHGGEFVVRSVPGGSVARGSVMVVGAAGGGGVTAVYSASGAVVAGCSDWPHP